MKKWIFSILFLLLTKYVFTVDFWEFKTLVGSVFNSDLEKKFFEDYRKLGKISDIDTWLLMASGVYDNEKIKYYRNFIDKLVSDISNSLVGQKISRYDLAKYIFDYLHKNIFRDYLEKSTDLDQLIDSGYYNCVNSTAMYNLLLKRFGYEPKVIQLPDHIFSVLYFDGYKIEIETTARKGFDVVRNPEAIKELKSRTSYVYVPEGKGSRVEIGDNGLIASMYANQVLNYKDISNYTEILKCSIKALILETNLFLAYTNLRSAYIGLFTKEVKVGNYQFAINLAEESLKIFPNDREIKDFLKISYYNYVLDLINLGEFSKSAQIILFLKDEKFEYFNSVKELIGYLVYKWGKDKISKGDYEGIFYVIDFGYKIDKYGTYSAGVNLLIDLSKVFLAKKDYKKVIFYNKLFLSKFPEGSEAKRNLGYYYNLWGLELMNSGLLEDSIKVFEEGIKDLPDDNVIKQNCSISYAKLSQLYFEKKDFESSMIFINRAIELNNSKQLNEIRRNIFVAWAKYLAFSEENFSKAKEVCQNGLKIYPNDVEIKLVYDYVIKKTK